MKSSVQLIFLESIRIIKSAVGIIVLIGGGLVPSLLFAQNFIGSSNFIQFTLCSIIIFLLALIIRITKYIDTISWNDKKYEKLYQTWTYNLSEDKKTFTGRCISERKVVSLCNSLKFITITIDKDQVLIPFQLEGKNNVELIEYYREQGTVVLNKAHKTSDSKFAFRLYFTPPLSLGETAYFKVKFMIDYFKISNLYDLRKYMTNSKIETRDFEYNSFNIVCPTKDFRFEVIMPKVCKAKYLGLTVYRGMSDVRFEQESDYIIKKKCFNVINETNEWRMKLERKNPPIKTKYIFTWRPVEDYKEFEV